MSTKLFVTMTDEEEGHDNNSKLFSQSTTIVLGITLIYIICTAIWFIQSRYCSAARRVEGPTTFLSLRQRLGLWNKGSLFFRNNTRNIIHYNYDNLPSHHDLDERDYKSWSVFQVASWSRSRLMMVVAQSNGNHHYKSSYYFIHDTSTQQQQQHGQQYQVSSNQEDDIILQQAIDALIQQRIDGASLDYITLEYLSRWMPFGTAVHLMSHYNALRLSTQSIHEGINNIENTNSLSTTTKEDILPSWYSDNHLHQAARNNNHHLDDGVEEQDQLSSEHVRRLMKERFGLSLPTLRTEEKELPSENMVASALEMTKQTTTTVRENETKLDSSDDNPTNNLGDILRAMPPHIRAVAERRPELVAELLSSRQHRQPLLLSIHEEEEEEEDGFDSESASLLRRRIK